ncbi:S8 family serine peptidase [Actinokineospora auranticolor]|uniref:Subtilase family protein n=1 Tax=Actinokineospora auranticolor TaxID=155976 RepID=A0A2S6H0G9_9PSEU|nr:S8 family serine peptidase [Actinokineospora auranticolor]PPK70907.1 subtilase family protein [Actinokineospora auranticolor]
MRSLVAVVVLSGLLLPTPALAQQGGQCAPPEATAARERGWAQQRMGAERVWPITKGAVLVAVVDTGVSAAAPALAGAVDGGVDLTGAASATVDCSGHGTFLAGLIAARPRDKTPFTGVAPAARVVPVRITDDPNRVDAALLAGGIRAAVASGARVVAVGVTTAVDAPELRSAVALARERDVVVIAPAAVRQPKQRAYPGSLDGVVAVAPVGPNGPVQATLGAEPTLAAPADQLVGIGPSGPGHRVATGPELGVAFVAGAAALVRDQYPELSAAEVVRRLAETADRPSGPSPNPLVGNGIVDPVAAVTTVVTAGGPVAARPERMVVPLPAVEDRGPATTALWFVAGLAGATAVAGAAAAVVARARRRRWHAG